jgi:hypothetical protein
LQKLLTKEKPNLKSNEPDQTDNAIDSSIEEAMDSESAYNLSKISS